MVHCQASEVLTGSTTNFNINSVITQFATILKGLIASNVLTALWLTYIRTRNFDQIKAIDTRNTVWTGTKHKIRMHTRLFLFPG